jgi:anti-anti-sigma factor
MLQLKIASMARSMIVYCQGRLVWSEEGALLKAISFMQDCDRITLDLAGVHSIDACGLGALATIAKSALRKKVELVISNPARRVYDLMHLVGMTKMVTQVRRNKAHKFALNPPTSASARLQKGGTANSATGQETSQGTPTSPPRRRPGSSGYLS